MKIFRIGISAILSFSLICILMMSCKKNDTTTDDTSNNNTNNNNNNSTEQTQQTKRSTDQTDMENTSTQALDDVNNVISEVSTAREVQTICGLTVDTSTTATTGYIYLHYDSTIVCNGTIRRGGDITVQLPVVNNQVVHFSTAGAVATLTFTNYKVTNVSNNTWMKFNGTEHVKNVNAGGFYALLFPGSSAVHAIKANLNVRFNDGTTAEWNAHLQRSFSNIGGTTIKVSIEGDTIIGGYQHVGYWGVNRLNEQFLVSSPQAYTYDMYNTTNNNSCIYKPLTGQVIIRYDSTYSKSLEVKYGMLGVNNPAPSGTCPTGFTIEWSGNNVTYGPYYVAYPY